MAFTVRCFIFAVLFGFACSLVAKLQSLMGIASELAPSTYVPDHPDCYTTACPKPQSKKWERLQKLCCPVVGTFHCQKTYYGDRNVRLCILPPILCPAGHFADMIVIREQRYPKEPLCHPCSAFHFQPEPTYSHMFSRPRCKHKRKLCDSLHAINVRYGDPSADDVCKCPSYLGYRPVRLPDNDCIEFNSSSGCSCIYEPCPKDLTMSATTYQCLDESLAKSLDSLGSSKEFIGGKDDLITDYSNKRDSCEGDACIDYSPKSWLSHLCSLHKSYGLALPVGFATVVCFVYFAARKLWKGEKRYDILVCICFASGKICERVFEELQNALPLLERLYGHLTLSHDPDSNCISVIVRPRLCKHQFSLLQFVRDLLSLASIRNDLNNSGHVVKIVALHGTSSEVKKMKSGLAALYFKEHLTSNYGELTLKLANEADEDAILRELVHAKGEIQQLLSEFHLTFASVRKGSIKIKFKLAHRSQTFDTLANEREIAKCVERILSLPSLQQLASNQEVKVEFVVKGSVGRVCVVQAENLLVQIGNKNTVHVCGHNHERLQEHEDEEDDDDEDGDHPPASNSATPRFDANVASIHVLTLAPNVRRRQQGPAAIEYGPINDAAQVIVRCNSQETARALQEQWFNVHHLLQRLYPACRMRREGMVIVWEVRTNEESEMKDITSFVNDIFKLQRVKAITDENHTEVNIVPPNNIKDLVRLEAAARNEDLPEQERGGIVNIFAEIAFLFLIFDSLIGIFDNIFLRWLIVMGLTCVQLKEGGW